MAQAYKDLLDENPRCRTEAELPEQERYPPINLPDPADQRVGASGTIT
jgi:hypothetical protein